MTTTNNADASAPNRTLLSLVLCTVGRQDCLIRFLDHLDRQTDRRFELIIVDQNDSDALHASIAPYKERFTIKYVRSARGLSLGRNVGLTFRDGTVVGFPDDDCWYPEDVVERVLSLFADPTVQACNGRTQDADGNDSINRYLDVPTRITKANIWNTHNSNALFIRSSTLELLGGFDPDLGVGAASIYQSGEEVDLILRIMQDSTPVYFQPDLIVRHEQVDAAFGATQILRAKKYAPGFGRILRVHDYGAAYFAYRIARTCFGALLAAVRLDSGKLRYKLAWAWGTLLGYITSPAPRRTS